MLKTLAVVALLLAQDVSLTVYPPGPAPDSRGVTPPPPPAQAPAADVCFEMEEASAPLLDTCGTQEMDDFIAGEFQEAGHDNFAWGSQGTPGLGVAYDSSADFTPSSGPWTFAIMLYLDSTTPEDGGLFIEGFPFGLNPLFLLHRRTAANDRFVLQAPLNDIFDLAREPNQNEWTLWMISFDGTDDWKMGFWDSTGEEEFVHTGIKIASYGPGYAVGYGGSSLAHPGSFRADRLTRWDSVVEWAAVKAYMGV